MLACGSEIREGPVHVHTVKQKLGDCNRGARAIAATCDALRHPRYDITQSVLQAIHGMNLSSLIIHALAAIWHTLCIYLGVG